VGLFPLAGSWQDDGQGEGWEGENLRCCGGATQEEFREHRSSVDAGVAPDGHVHAGRLLRPVPC